MVSKILEETERSVVKLDVTLYVSIPQLWLGQLGIKEGGKVKVALIEGNRGKFLGVWKNDKN